jgi:WD40 repeat protein
MRTGFGSTIFVTSLHEFSDGHLHVNRPGSLPSGETHIMRMPTASYRGRVRFPGPLNGYSGSLPALLIAVALIWGYWGAGNAKGQDEFPVPDSPAAPPAKIVIPPEGEPGEPLVISGTIYQPHGKTPAAGVTLYVFHTDAEGIYSSHQEERKPPKPRLHGWLRTKADGRYEFRTIRPGAYPGGDTPTHIHAGVYGRDTRYWINDYWFADDLLITAKQRKRVDGPEGSGKVIVALKRDDKGVWRGTRDITLKKALHLVLQAPPVISVNSVAVSPDGSIIATGAEGVRLYDARTGVLLRALGGSWDEKGAGGRGVAFSPDGRTLAGAGFSRDKLVGIVDVQTGKRVQTLAGHTEWETDAVAFSPDGKLLASTGADKQILVWELATGKLRHRLADQPFRAPALAFSPDSATLASGGDKTTGLWDVATGRLRRSLEGHRDWVCTLAFAPDGKTIASGSCDWGFHRGHDWPRPVWRGAEQFEWRLWDVASGKVQRTVTEPGRMLSLAFAPDGKSLASGIGKEVRLYDVGSETPGRVVTSHDFAVTSVAFTKDGSAVLSGSHDHTVKRTSLATGQTDWQAPGYFEQVNAVALSKDAALLVTGSSDGRYAHGVLKAGATCLGPGAVRLWDARTGRLLRRLGDPAEQVMAVSLAPDGRHVAGGGGSAGGSGIVRVWDTATGTAAWSADDHKAEVLAIAYAPDGSSVVTAAADGLIKVRDPKTGAVQRTLEGHDGGATSVTFSADGALLVCGDGRGGARFWDPHTGRLLRTCRAGGSQTLTAARDPSHRLPTSLALSPDGRTLVTNAGGFDEPAKFWDTQTGELKKEVADKGHGAQPVALSPDGSILAAGGKTVKLWDVRTGNLVRELFGHLKLTQAITFSADGRLLVSGGSYGTTNVWEVATGRHLVTLFTFPESRNGKVVDDWLAYHPDGFYDGSPGVERYLAWRVGEDLKTPRSLGAQLHRPDQIESALKLQHAEAR